MRPITPLFAALALLAVLAGCGTKTPLTLPPPQAPAKAAEMSSTPQPALADDRHQTRAEARQ